MFVTIQTVDQLVVDEKNSTNVIAPKLFYGYMHG